MLGFNGGLLGRRRKQEPTTPGMWFPNERAVILSPSFDPYWDSVSLLLPMNGSNGSTTFTDSSSNALTVTANGNAQISTAQSKFGGASGLFDGTGDFLTISNNGAFSFGVADFTIEMWIRASSLSNAPFLFSKVSESDPPNGWFLEISSTLLYFGYSTESSAFFATFDVTISTNQWTHIAVTRATSTLGAYVDGVGSTKTLSGAQSDRDNSNQVFIGRYRNANTAFDFDGYIDDLRITKGVARYTANFTPPTAAFPNE